MDSCKKMFWNVFFLDRNNSKDKKFFLKWHYEEILNDWIHDSLEILNFHRFLSLVILIKRSLMGKNNAVYVWYFHTRMRLLYVFLFLFFSFITVSWSPMLQLWSPFKICYRFLHSFIYQRVYISLWNVSYDSSRYV